MLTAAALAANARTDTAIIDVASGLLPRTMAQNSLSVCKECENELQIAGREGGTDLRMLGPPYRQERETIDGSVSEHVQAICHQAHGVRNNSRADLDYEHRSV